MIRFNYLLILIVILIYIPNDLFSTEQIGDVLIVDNDTVSINSTPLEEYFRQKGERKIGDIYMGDQLECTALYRGYIATWEIRDDSLFLICIEINGCDDFPEIIDLLSEFGSKSIFAYWASGLIIKPVGELLSYSRVPYNGVVYEGEVDYRFQKGIISKKERKTYLIKEEGLVFPGEDFLRDTLREIIIKSIPDSEIKKFKKRNYTEITIRFNANRQLSGIDYSWNNDKRTYMDESILKHAKKALANFPALMDVNIEDIIYPVFYLKFDGHCIKKPDDKKYGCK